MKNYEENFWEKQYNKSSFSRITKVRLNSYTHGFNKNIYNNKRIPIDTLHNILCIRSQVNTH